MDIIKFKTRFPLILAAVIFFIAAFDAFLNQQFWWGLANFITALANIAAVKYFNKYPELTTVFLSILNAIIAFITAWLFIEAGKQYIQFAWVLTGVVYLFLSFRFLNLAQKKYL